MHTQPKKAKETNRQYRIVTPCKPIYVLHTNIYTVGLSTFIFEWVLINKIMPKIYGVCINGIHFIYVSLYKN